MISTVDVAPTLLGMVALPEEARFLDQVTGRDVLATDYRRRPVLSRTSPRKRAAGRKPAPTTWSLTGRRWKYTRDERGSEQLFDLSVDPWELAPITDRPTLVAQLRASLRRQRRAHRLRADELQAGDTLPADPALIEELRLLGYLEVEDGVDGEHTEE